MPPFVTWNISVVSRVDVIILVLFSPLPLHFFVGLAYDFRLYIEYSILFRRPASIFLFTFAVCTMAIGIRLNVLVQDLAKLNQYSTHHSAIQQIERKRREKRTTIINSLIHIQYNGTCHGAA